MALRVRATIAGWSQVFYAGLAEMFMVGMVFYTFPLLFTIWVDDIFAGSRASTALVFTFFIASSAFYAPLVGELLGRINAMRCIVMGLFFYALGFVLWSLSTEPWQVYAVAAGPLSIGATLLGGLAPPKHVMQWFDSSNNRGVALGLAAVGISAGGVVFPFIFSLLTDNYSWAASMQIYAMIAFVAVPVFLFLLRTPTAEELKSINQAYPTPARSEAEIAESEAESKRYASLQSWRQILTTFSFWLIVILVALQFFTVSGLISHLNALMTDLQFPKTTATNLLMLTAFAAMLGKVAVGYLVKKLGRVGPTLALYCLLQVVGLVIILLSHEVWHYAIALSFWGFGWGAGVPLLHMGIAEILPLSAFARALGYSRPIMVPIQVAGGPVIGLTYDITQSYDQALVGLIALMVLVTAAALFFNNKKSSHA